MVSHRAAIAAGAALVAVGVLIATHSRHVEAPASERAGPRAQAPAEPQKPNAPPVAIKPAARAPAVERSPSKTETVVRADWGNRVGQLGHKRPAEGAPEGPMAMALDSRGRIHVLDQVNGRIQIFEPGKSPRVIDLPGEAYQDIAIDDKDRTIVMDRLATQSLAVVDERGSVVQTIPITGEGLSEGGAATALVAADDGTWVESEHQQLVRIADASGAPDRARPTLAGRPSLDRSTLLRASLVAPRSIAVSGISRTGQPGWETRLDFPLPPTGIRALESDASGRVYVAVHLMLEAPFAPFDVEDEKQVVVVLSRTGDELGRIAIAAPTTPDEQFRPIRVSADGAVYQLVCSDDGATVEKYVL